MTAIIVIGVLALVLAAPRGSAQANIPTHEVGDEVGYGTSIDIDEALQPAIMFLQQEDEGNDNFTINELSVDGAADIWATTEVVDKSADAYSIQTNSAFGIKLRYIVNVTFQDAPAAGTYPGNVSRGCFPDSLSTSDLTFSADIDITYLVASTGLGSWTIDQFALEEDETNSSLELRTTATYFNALYFDLDMAACELTVEYRSASYETNAEIGMDMRTRYDPALDVFAFPIQDGEVWPVHSIVTQGGNIRGTVDVSGLTPGEEQELFDGLNQALESYGFSVSGLDGFPVDLENVTILLGTTEYLKDGVIHDQSAPLDLSLEARETSMTLADGKFHTVYLISGATGDMPIPYAPVCSAVYSPEAEFIVGYRCDLAGATVFELPNVPPETAEEHIAQTRRDYTLNPTGTGSDFLGNFFLRPPFSGILLIAAVAVLVAALLVRRRRKPAPAPPGATPPSRFFAHDWQHDYFSIKRQVANHAFEYGRLLRVLLTKERNVRAHNVQKDRNYSRHPAKVTLPRSPFELFRQSFNCNVRRKFRRIDVARRWGEQIIDVFARQQCGVAIQLAWILLKVLRRPKLRRINKDRNH